MKPIIALVGRPNVGKSTLFNKLTRSRDALVADHAGLTRDRIYGTAEIEGCSFILIDTGGLTERSDSMSGLMRQQAQLAIEEADTIFFLVDGRAGLTAADEDVATQLRNADKPVILVVNKAEGGRPEMMAADFYSLGLGEPQVISATQNRGLSSLMAQLRD
ncbi:MAG: GTP-binding protein, partial [Piscirickettsiaceae bacterium]|nr:GTP-binding protein [Piscirickettsiaceae bacterium]